MTKHDSSIQVLQVASTALQLFNLCSQSQSVQSHINNTIQEACADTRINLLFVHGVL